MESRSQKCVDSNSIVYTRRTKCNESGKLMEESIDLDHHFKTTYNGYDGDDEVFIEVDESASYKMNMNKPPMGRERRTSDVIDSLGDDSPVRMRRVTSPDLALSPPMTPRSDPGYSSSRSSLLLSPFEPKWFRFSSTCDSIPVSSTKLTEEVAGKLMKRSLVNDATDAMPVQSSQPMESKSEIGNGRGGIAVAPVSRFSNEYKMSHPRRGIGIIFNHQLFKSNPARPGSKKDVHRLENMYKLLGLEPRVYDDMSYNQIMEIMMKLSYEDHSENDCLMVTILTHGLQSNYLHAYDAPYKIDDLWSCLTADNCVTLAGKPKIFFIQACRGTALDPGVQMMARTQTDSGSESYMIPKMADFFIAQSTFEGYYSWRNPEEGTWFIQSLVDVFEECHEHLDLATIMTRVTLKVAVEYESYHDQVPEYHRQKQVPSTTSTLLRQVFFTPKN